MLATLRKFGLEHCDLPTMIWNMSVLLKALSLNIDKRNTKGIPTFFYVFTTIITICYVYVYFVSMFWFVFVRCPETGEFLVAIIVFSLGITSEIAAAKFLFMNLNRNLVQDLVERSLYCDSIVTPGSRLARNIRSTSRAIKKRAMTFWFLIIGNGFIYAVQPIILPGRHLMDDSLIMYGLEPMFETPNYQIAFCITLCAIIFIVYTVSNMTAFLIIITGYIEAQLLGLSEEITQLWQDAEEHFATNNPYEDIVNLVQFKNKAINEYIKKELKKIAKSHILNIDLIAQTENVFRGAIAIEFMLLIISLIAELLGGLENTYLEIPFAMMQVGMDCLVGQRLIDASLVFESAVYDSKWENFDKSNMKTIFVMLQNSQKTLTLSAGGLAILDFVTLMSLLKSIYSTYTTLRSTMNIK